MTRRVSYTKEMREIAKRDKRHLATIDVFGMTFQGPCTKEEAEIVSKAFIEVTKKQAQP